MATKLAPLLVFLIFWHPCPSWELNFRWQQDYEIFFIAKSAKIARQYVNFFDLLFFGKSLHALYCKSLHAVGQFFGLPGLPILHFDVTDCIIISKATLFTFYLPKSNWNVINSNYKWTIFTIYFQSIATSKVCILLVILLPGGL